MGKGQFLLTLAKENPSINYIGIERYSSVLLRALERFDNDEGIQGCQQYSFYLYGCDKSAGGFAVGEIDKIYLNFFRSVAESTSCKAQTYFQAVFERYDKILAFDGVVEFKTDNRELFDFSLEQVELAGWVLLAKTYDLHNDPTLSRGNVMTEYEEKFFRAGTSDP